MIYIDEFKSFIFLFNVVGKWFHRRIITERRDNEFIEHEAK